MKSKPAIAARAKVKQEQGINQYSLSQTSVEPSIDTQKELAILANVSHDTINKVENIENKAIQPVKDLVKSSSISINQAAQTAKLAPEVQEQVIPFLEKGMTVEAARRELKIHESKERIATIEQSSDAVDIYNTNNKYQIIYADPPWGGYFKAGNKNQENHYPLMSIEEICNLPVSKITDENAILFLWVTFPILDKAFEVIKSWGFTYSTCAFCWVKQNKSGDGYFFGNGNWTHANTELCLLATKGSITRLDASISQLIVSPLQEHSKKPDETRNLITRLVGELKRIELFSRDSIEGWDAWGLEVKQNQSA